MSGLHDLEAERATLGGMLMGLAGIEAAIEATSAGEFYLPKHEQIFSTILGLYEASQPVGPVTVAAELGKRGELEKTGGHAYLAELTECVAVPENAGHFAQLVHDQHTLRTVQAAGMRITQMAAVTDGSDADEIVKRAQAEAYALALGRDENRLSTNLEALELVMTKLDKPIEIGVQTGFADLDRVTGGLLPGQLVIIAARPAIGKSTADLDLHRNVSIRHGQPSLLFSLEMGHEEIMKKTLAAEARVNFHHLRYGNMTDRDWDSVSRTVGRIAAAPLHVDDTPGLTLTDIASRSRQLARKEDLKLISVDYLQLVTHRGGRRNESRQQEVAEISRGLKLLAKELHVPIVALCQLNRGPEGRADKKPMMSDLRESGALEQDADVVILLHRESAYEAESPRAGEADLLLVKNRLGPTAEITVAFQGHYSRFVDMASDRAESWSPSDAAR